MQDTYKGKTAGGYLKTAHVAKSGAGLSEIFVPAAGPGVIAMRGDRRDGWGGTKSDVLVLVGVDGPVVRLSTSPRAYNRLRELERELARVDVRAEVVEG